MLSFITVSLIILLVGWLVPQSYRPFFDMFISIFNISWAIYGLWELGQMIIFAYHFFYDYLSASSFTRYIFLGGMSFAIFKLYFAAKILGNILLPQLFWFKEMRKSVILAVLVVNLHGVDNWIVAFSSQKYGLEPSFYSMPNAPFNLLISSLCISFIYSLIQNTNVSKH